MVNKRISRVFVMTVLSLCTLCLSDDWPQFRGPDRNGKASETGLLKKWPANGPPQLWQVSGLGDGYSSAAIANGLVYTTGMKKGQGSMALPCITSFMPNNYRVSRIRHGSTT